MVAKENIVYACHVGYVESCGSLVATELRGIIARVETVSKMELAAADIVTDNVNAIWTFIGSNWEEGQGSHWWLEGLRTFNNKPAWTLRHVFREYNEYADALAKGVKRCKWSWSRMDGWMQFRGRYMVNLRM